MAIPASLGTGAPPTYRRGSAFSLYPNRVNYTLHTGLGALQFVAPSRGRIACSGTPLQECLAHHPFIY